MTFSASYGRATKVISACVCLLLFAVIAATHSLVISMPLLLVILVCYAYSPRGYVIADRSILVRRWAGPARIALDDVREVRRATPDDLSSCVRLWASGGVFGYYGVFSTARLGKSTWYVTDRNNSVVLITGSKTALFSPDDVDGFLNAIHAVTPVPTPAPLPAFTEPRRSGAFGSTIGAAVGIAAIGLVVAATVYSPGPPGYTLTASALTIHDRFYPVTLQAGDVDIDQIRIVDLTHDSAWHLTARTNGFGNTHYQSGWFRVAGVPKEVRLYRADGHRVVLLPPKGDSAPVLYQAANPQAFVTEVRAAWSSATRSSTNAGK